MSIPDHLEEAISAYGRARASEAASYEQGYGSTPKECADARAELRAAIIQYAQESNAQCAQNVGREARPSQGEAAGIRSAGPADTSHRGSVQGATTVEPTAPVAIQIDKTIVEGVIRERIAAAVVKELGNADALMAQAIELALKTKVNSQGVVSGRSYDDTFTFLEATAANAIRASARQAVADWTAANKGRIYTAVMTQLKNRQTAIAKALVEKFEEKAKSDGLSVTISVLDERKSY